MLHEVLSTMRAHAGLTALEVSHALHVSPPVVYQWERGDTRPRCAHLAALMRLYEATPAARDEVAHLAAFNAPRGSL